MTGEAILTVEGSRIMKSHTIDGLRLINFQTVYKTEKWNIYQLNLNNLL